MSERKEADAMVEMDAARKLGPTRRAWSVALLVAGALLMTTATGVSLAQEPDSRPTAAVRAEAATPSDTSSTDQTALRSNLGELPFTPLDLMILGGIAMVLLGTGMALRRLSAPRVEL